MKLEARRVEGFLADPGACRVVLLHGEDAGLVHERAAALVRRVAGSLDDPFRVADLERDGINRIVEEMAARSLTGGRRVVRVRDVTDTASGAIQGALASRGEGLVVLEAGELTGRSKLRAVVEASPDAVAIACYSEQGAELSRTVVAALKESGLRIDSDAADYAMAHLGNDRGVTRQELEKLALYAWPGTVIDLEAVMAVVGDLAGLQINDALFAATEGDVATADRALGLAVSEGAKPVSILRTMLMHLQRLEQIRVFMLSGQSPTDAVRGLRPPVFDRRQQASLIRAAGLWTAEALGSAAAAVWETERACKQTGAPDMTLCRHVIMTIARRAETRRR